MDEVLDTVDGFALKQKWNNEFFFEDYFIRYFRLERSARQAAANHIKQHNRKRYWERFGDGDELPDYAQPGRELTHDDFEIVPITVNIIKRSA